MSNHGKIPDPFLAREHGLGPTGRGVGATGPSDRGELKVAIRILGDRVRLDFGFPVAWASLTPDEADAFAAGLVAAAATARGARP